MMQRRDEKYKSKDTVTQEPTLLDCPQCHSFIASDHINESKHTAKCGHCHHIFNYQTDGYWDPFGPPLYTQPEGLEILRLPSLLDIRVKHRSNVNRMGTFTTLGFSLLWNAMLLPFLFYIVTSGQLFVLLFISVHLFVGVSMLWQVLGHLFNQTTIEVDSHFLTLRTTPFSLVKGREKQIPTEDVEQLYVNRARSKKRKIGSNYALHIRLKSGKTHELLSGLDKRTLQYLERQVEDYLGIKNTR